MRKFDWFRKVLVFSGDMELILVNQNWFFGEYLPFRCGNHTAALEQTFAQLVYRPLLFPFFAVLSHGQI